MAELIVAFDLPSGSEALALAARLPGLRWAKVGPVLFNREGPSLVREFTARGIRVFLDLKWHDIPHIVASAVSAARELGVSMTTVHCLGGRAMLTAAATAAGQDLDVARDSEIRQAVLEELKHLLGRDRRIRRKDHADLDVVLGPEAPGNPLPDLLLSTN